MLLNTTLELIEEIKKVDVKFQLYDFFLVQLIRISEKFCVE